MSKQDKGPKLGDKTHKELSRKEGQVWAFLKASGFGTFVSWALLILVVLGGGRVLWRQVFSSSTETSPSEVKSSVSVNGNVGGASQVAGRDIINLKEDPVLKAKLAEISEVQNLLQGLNEYGLAEYLDLNRVLKINCLMLKNVLRSDLISQTESNAVKEYLKDASRSFNLLLVDVTTNERGMQTIQPKPGHYPFLYQSPKSHSSLHKLQLMSSSLLLPSTICTALGELHSSATTNLEQITLLLDEAMGARPEEVVHAYDGHHSLAGVLQNTYTRRCLKLEPKAKAVQRSIREFLTSDATR